MTMNRTGRHGRLLLLALIAVAVTISTTTAAAKTSVAPTNNGAPSISGTPREGHTLTASNGSWDNAPTSFSYQWQRCGNTGSGCTGITGATGKTYDLVTADVDHTVRVIVTATNADGSASANSRVTGLVAASNGPTVTAQPTISGTAAVGEQLTASPGTWSGGARSFTYQWQSCSTSGTCADITGATGQSYDVRTADIGSSVRVAVTAHSTAGSSTATSAQTTTVAAPGGNPTPMPKSNQRPTIGWVSLTHVGNRVYARFRTCDDSTARVKVVERDTMAHESGYVRNYAVSGKPCATYSRNWLLLPRYRHVGRYTVTLHAVDRQNATSRAVSRSLHIA
jgi:hypothetical protein